ncbi:MAG: hypothetical protein V1736_03315 [Pseudomonadota bacterium]
MPALKKKITPDEFVELFTERVLEKGQFAEMYEHFSAAVPQEELSERHFCEYLMLSFFIDSLCLKWAFHNQEALSLQALYRENLLIEVPKRLSGLSCTRELNDNLEKRFKEYEKAASRIKSVSMNTQATLDSLTALGEAFSKHFVGHENIETILKVKWFFLMKEDVLYEKFLKRLGQTYNVTFQ